jgi:hypothetical protein
MEMLGRLLDGFGLALLGELSSLVLHHTWVFRSDHATAPASWGLGNKRRGKSQRSNQYTGVIRGKIEPGEEHTDSKRAVRNGAEEVTHSL